MPHNEVCVSARPPAHVVVAHHIRLRPSVRAALPTGKPSSHPVARVVRALDRACCGEALDTSIWPIWRIFIILRLSLFLRPSLPLSLSIPRDLPPLPLAPFALPRPLSPPSSPLYP